jgi:hypothetical protein
MHGDLEVAWNANGTLPLLALALVHCSVGLVLAHLLQNVHLFGGGVGEFQNG